MSALSGSPGNGGPDGQDDADNPSSLEAAQEIIVRQQRTIEDLRKSAGAAREFETFRGSLVAAATAGAVSAPTGHEHLLETIVETARQVIGAEASGLFTLDEATNELICEVAYGGSGPGIRKQRLPAGKGIVGLAAASGQPMLINDTSENANVFKFPSGYIPRNILCVPMYLNERVVGVLELLDKIGEPTFSLSDIEVLSLFADQAAITIDLSRNRSNMVSLLRESLARAAPVPPSLLDSAARLAGAIEGQATFERTMGLAELVRQIVQEGDAEAAACRAILGNFADYLKARNDRRVWHS